MTTKTPVIGSFAGVPLHSCVPRNRPQSRRMSPPPRRRTGTRLNSWWHTPEGIDVTPVLLPPPTAAAEAEGYLLHSFPGELPLCAADDVCEPAVDHPPVRRGFPPPRIPRLPSQPGRRPEGCRYLATHRGYD